MLEVKPYGPYLKDEFFADALARIVGATTTADTYPGLRATLAALGDRHSFFRPPGRGVGRRDSTRDVFA